MAAKRKDTALDLNAPYEQNEIQLRGIVGFTIGLFLLIVITFGLMWALMAVLKDYHRQNSPPPNPLAMSDMERLPPEPRLQLAPGFGIPSEKGRINLELREPQAEYRELLKQWVHLWEHGSKDAATGAVNTLPIEEAKERFLRSGVKARSDARTAEASRLQVSDASSGRMATEKW